MNTRDLEALGDWDELELTALVAWFVGVFHRLPSNEDLVALRRTRSGTSPAVTHQRATTTVMVTS